MSTGFAYIEGKFVPVAEANLNVMTHALHYGTAVFEGIRGNWNEDKKEMYLFRLREHLERLLSNCRFLDIKLPYSVEDLAKIILELAKTANLKEDVYIRPLAYKSQREFGVRINNLSSDILIVILPRNTNRLAEYVRAGVSSWRRPDNSMLPPQIKAAGLYLNNALVKTEAIQNGFDEGIILSNEGKVTEGSGENLFLVKNGRLLTPCGNSGILLGITRDTVKRIAKEQFGIDTEERLVDRYELYLADEAFFTSTIAHVLPIGFIDHHPIGNGQVGLTTQKIRDYYAELIRGRRTEYPQWLTAVFYP